MRRMELMDLCSLFDRSEIVDSQTQIDREYYASTDTIYSDGEVKTNVTRDAYIHITSVRGVPNYLMFVDIESKIYLCVYKYIPATKYKIIRQQLQILKTQLDRLNEHEWDDDIIDEYIDDDVVDINTFKCTECNSTEEFNFIRSKTNPEAIETKCKICKTEYIFVPSKYYKMSSKKVVYHKSEKSSRQIAIMTPSSTTTTVVYSNTSTLSQ